MENGGIGKSLYRHLTFMTYLNTLDNAGTEFWYQKTTTPCEKRINDNEFLKVGHILTGCYKLRRRKVYNNRVV